MKRTANQVAHMLTGIYGETFSNDQFEPYRLGWSELRALAGGVKLESGFIGDINEALEESNYALVPFESFLVVISESDFKTARKLTGRVLERSLPDEEEGVVEDDADDEEVEDDEA
jgi:hypothetical protein